MLLSIATNTLSPSLKHRFMRYVNQAMNNQALLFRNKFEKVGRINAVSLRAKHPIASGRGRSRNSVRDVCHQFGAAVLTSGLSAWVYLSLYSAFQTIAA